jgi:WD40 repeat protein
VQTFELNLSSIEREAETFKSTWSGEPRADQRALAIEGWKQATGVFSPFETMEKDGRRRTWKNSKVLPLWHGSSSDKCDSISTSGFVYFGKTSLGSKQSDDPESTDEGYFGSGIYFTNSARYAGDIYSKGHLMLAWVSMREPFPIVGDPSQTDMKALKGKGAYKHYNAHYIPVVPIDPDPHCAIYHPCKKGENPACDEIVVFHKSQTLPRFWIELEIELPYLMSPSEKPLFVSELVPHLFKLLQNPYIDRDLKLRNILNSELALLLKMKDDDDLEEKHETFFVQLTQLIDQSGKVNKSVRQILTESNQTSQIPAITLSNSKFQLQQMPIINNNNTNPSLFTSVSQLNIKPNIIKSNIPSPQNNQAVSTKRNWKADPSVQTITGHTGIVQTVIELKDGTLASGSGDRTIKLWDRNGNCLKTFTGHTRVVFALIELKDGTLASGSSDKTIKLWDRSGKCLKTLTGHTSHIWALIELKDGTLASGSGDKTIKLWDRNGKCLKTFTGHTNYVLTLIELKDGTLASGSYDNTIKLWNHSGKCLKTLTGHTDYVQTIIELKDGTLASGSPDKTIKLWDHSGNCLKTLTGHTSSVLELIELKDGTLASGSWDKTIKLWNRSDKCLKTLTGHTDIVSALIELKDGTLASGSDDKTIKLWSFPEEAIDAKFLKSEDNEDSL